MNVWWLKKGESLRNFAENIARYHAGSLNLLNKTDAEVQQCSAAYAKIIKQAAKEIRRMQKCKNADKQKQLSWIIFQRPSVRKAAVLISTKNNERFKKRLTPESLNERARECLKFHNLQEPIHHQPKKKSDGRHRDTWAFGPVRYVQQIILGWLVSAVNEPCLYDYSLQGHGSIHGAAKAIGGYLKKGYRLWVVSDIKSAYPSISKGHLRQLCHLDERLVRYIAFPTLPIDDCQLPLIPMVTATDFNNTTATIRPTKAKAPRSQLPQGAAHSPVILSALIGECLRNISLSKVVVVIFADNIAIGAQYMADAKSAFLALEKALGNLKPGGLLLHDVKYCDGYQHASEDAVHPMFGQKIYWSIDFCGYCISFDQGDKKIRYRPSRRAWEKFWRKIKEEKTNSNMIRFTRFKITFKEFHTWRKSFPLWKLNAYSMNMFRINMFFKC